MNQGVKDYADTLYASARMASGRSLVADRKEYLAMMSVRIQNGPLSGQDVKRISSMYVNHIERCMRERLHSYQQAFQEAHLQPTEQQLQDIWAECRAIREAEVRIAAANLKQFIASHGNSPFIPAESHIESESGHGHDRVLQDWKIWRAKTQLKPATLKLEVRERQIDKLMGLHNRAEFDDELATLCASSSAKSPLSLLFMDLDKFKSINDGPGGHEAGDRALKLFADAVNDATQGKGTAFRYGGDEVCVLLPNHVLDEACAVAERIRSAVSAISGEGVPNGLSTSIGAATLPETTSDAKALCPQADKAMYASKQAGGNRVSKANAEGPRLR